MYWEEVYSKYVPDHEPVMLDDLITAAKMPRVIQENIIEFFNGTLDKNLFIVAQPADLIDLRLLFQRIAANEKNFGVRHIMAESIISSAARGIDSAYEAISALRHGRIALTDFERLLTPVNAFGVKIDIASYLADARYEAFRNGYSTIYTSRVTPAEVEAVSPDAIALLKPITQSVMV